ncbi:MAG: hypothetical protein JW809_01720 [Pirellulales bacterium]|nr:hypothetical protein [Pirellulales bacterium]
MDDHAGAVVEDVKNATYQGRGLWVYSFLCKHFGHRQPWRDAARGIRDFALRYLHAGSGTWRERTRGDRRRPSCRDHRTVPRVLLAEAPRRSAAS